MSVTIIECWIPMVRFAVTSGEVQTCWRRAGWAKRTVFSSREATSLRCMSSSCLRESRTFGIIHFPLNPGGDEFREMFRDIDRMIMPGALQL
jgi:hypothetical protein